MRQLVFRSSRLLPRRNAGRVARPLLPVGKQSVDELLASFRAHLQDVGGLAAASCDHYCYLVRAFLREESGGKARDFRSLSAGELVGYVSQQAAATPGKARLVVTALRAFLRWLQFLGVCDARLAGAVPGFPYRRLATIPRLLTDEQLRLLLTAFDRSTSKGRRDYAIALCMVRLGIRSGEVARLRLDDIDWRAGTIRIDGSKRRRSHVLPLPSDLARAIVAYLKRGRQGTSAREVFLRYARDPRPMRSADIQYVIRRAHERGQVGGAWKGTHALRHTLASRLLRDGATLKQIADILGHRSIDTTAIYAKVDIERLTEVALPWAVERP